MPIVRRSADDRLRLYGYALRSPEKTESVALEVARSALTLITLALTLITLTLTLIKLTLTSDFVVE